MLSKLDFTLAYDTSDTDTYLQTLFLFLVVIIDAIKHNVG